MDKVEILAQYFNINRSDLIEEKPPGALTTRDKRDIEKILDQTREQLMSQEGLMFDGKPASPEAIDSILSAMQIGMEIAKKKNKEKYTPKKYKKSWCLWTLKKGWRVGQKIPDSQSTWNYPGVKRHISICSADWHTSILPIFPTE